MRSFGRLERGRSATGIDIEKLCPERVKSGDIRQLGNGRAWALVRTDLPDLLWCEKSDGSFAIIDGELFGTIGGQQTGAAQVNKAAVILERFRAEGTSIFATLNGSASVIVWDSKSSRLALARDRSGLGICFWTESPTALTFSSDILSLVRSDVRGDLNSAAVDLFLANGFIPAPWTSLSHINLISAAHVLIADRGGTKILRYWRCSGRPKLRMARKARKERQEQALLQAVERQLPGTRQSALLLSGGIDSMCLAAVLVHHFGTRPIAFTYRYTDYEGKFNESPRARAAAEALGLEHHEIMVRPVDIASSLESMLIAHSGPLSFGAHSAVLRDVAASGAEVLYNGLEADAPYCSAAELLGVLLRVAPLPHAAIVRAFEQVFVRGPRWVRSLAYVARVAASGLTWRFHEPLTPAPIRRALYLEANRAEQGQRAAEQLFAEVVAEFADDEPTVRINGPVSQLLNANSSNRWASCFGRAHGLLPRSPLLDEEYDELLSRMPWSPGKREIRELTAKMLPPELAFAPKVGQTLPLADWLRTPTSDFITGELLEARIVAGGLFRHETVDALIKRHRSGAGSFAWTLWNVLMISLWQEIVQREAGTALDTRYPSTRDQLTRARPTRFSESTS